MIIAYFGFTRKNVLPTGHVLERLPEDFPDNGELLNSFPPVKSAITEFTIEYEKLLNKVVDITAVNIQFTTEIIEDTKEGIKKLEKIINITNKFLKNFYPKLKKLKDFILLLCF